MIPTLAHLLTLASLAAGYRPLLDPLPIDRHWPWLLPVLAVLIALAYKAIKLASLHDLPRQVAIMTAQIVVGVILAAAGLWALVIVV